MKNGSQGAVGSSSVLSARQLVLAFILVSDPYFLLRMHPVSYDIGRHITLFAEDRSAQFQSILRGRIDLRILRYGVLSLLAPLTAFGTVILFWVGGWLSLLLACWGAMLWSQRQFSTPWIGLAYLGAVEFWGPRHLALFGNHPYEMGLNLFLAAVFFAGLRHWTWVIGVLLVGMLVHPNLLPLGCLVLLFLFKALDGKRGYLAAISAIAAVGFYFLSAR